jgi:peroxiredoxin (alkyl hydroperoxide reductase subunit C)
MKKTFDRIKKLLIYNILLGSVIALSYHPSTAQGGSSSFLLIGDTVPPFQAATSQGIMHFPEDFNGKWKIIFSHPGDFTPVCTSELLTFSLMYDDFKSLNCELIGLSVDGYDSHLEWITSMESLEYRGQTGIQVRFPIISDVRMEIAGIFGMVHPHALSTRTIRAVHIIDPDNVINAILYYPATVGRNIEEIKRTLIALQTAAQYNVNTPENWHPGDPIIVRSPQNKEEFEKHETDKKSGDINCLDWYFCFKHLPL